MNPPRPDPRLEAQDTPIPMASGRALARHIVDEFRPVLAALVRQEVANASLEVNQRLTALETWRKEIEDGGGDADITGTHSVEDLRRRAEKAEARLKRKVERERMEIAATDAVQKANHKQYLSLAMKAIGIAWAGIISYLLAKR